MKKVKFILPLLMVFILGASNVMAQSIDYGWKSYRLLKDPKIIIMGSRAVTPMAMNTVFTIYTEITKRLTAKYPKNRFDGYIIYVTNGEPWSELKKLVPIGTLWPDQTGTSSGDFLRGGTTPNYLWIDEQMICKTGVRTRNEAFAAGLLAKRDNEVRTFDQVVHEFAHAIAYRFNLSSRISEIYKGGWSPVEQFPWSVQNYFSTPAPAQELNEKETAFMKEIFTGKTTFSCDSYKNSTRKGGEYGENVYYVFQPGDPEYKAGEIGGLIAAEKDIEEKGQSKGLNWDEAKKACEALGSGWRLPTQNELDRLYQNRNMVGGLSTSGTYWSSKEYDTNDAVWAQIFSNGNKYYLLKRYTTYARAVKTFSVKLEYGNQIFDGSSVTVNEFGQSFLVHGTGRTKLEALEFRIKTLVKDVKGTLKIYKGEERNAASLLHTQNIAFSTNALNEKVSVPVSGLSANLQPNETYTFFIEVSKPITPMGSKTNSYLWGRSFLKSIGYPSFDFYFNLLLK